MQFLSTFSAGNSSHSIFCATELQAFIPFIARATGTTQGNSYS